MNVTAIRHDAITGCYALDEKTLTVRLETGKDIVQVNVYAGDPYTSEYGKAWTGEKLSMSKALELKNTFVWEVVVTPEYKRLQYYFEVVGSDERKFLFEDGLHDSCYGMRGAIVQYFKYAWLNAADVCAVPKWAEDVVWYQIFPDRFRRADGVKCSHDVLAWGEEKNARFDSFYGGNLRGIIEKLGYIKELGISGLYLTPIMLSDTNHRYNVHDYTLVDPDVGDQGDLKELIDKAHGMGIKVMLDAVFNHCGNRFFAWRDVLEKGDKSKYFDWFYINDRDFANKTGNTKDGRYYSFAFAAYMPKLNTGNPEVAEYLTGICQSWVALGIDGIRFDVGNEVSHAFLKKLRSELKAVKPDLFLLGEIWHRALPWLLGDEYDSIMNYQFLESVNDFFIDKQSASRELMYALNESYNNYYRQINGVLFNMLDNHDVDRAVTRCGSVDGLLQELAILMTMRGSPCIYYGTEVGLGGEVGGSHNRRCMPWREIDGGMFDGLLSEFKKITALRKHFLPFKNGDIYWKDTGERIVDYVWQNTAGNSLEVLLNASEADTIAIPDGQVLYARKFDGKRLLAGGIAVIFR